MKLGKTVGRSGWSKRHKRHWASQDAPDFTSKSRESCREEMRHACPAQALNLWVSRLGKQEKKLENLEK